MRFSKALRKAVLDKEKDPNTSLYQISKESQIEYASLSRFLGRIKEKGIKEPKFHNLSLESVDKLMNYLEAEYRFPGKKTMKANV